MYRGAAVDCRPSCKVGAPIATLTARWPLAVLFVTSAAFGLGLGLGFGVGARAPIAGAHGGDASKIHACVKSNGAIRMVQASGSCKKGETPLDWGLTPGVAGLVVVSDSADSVFDDADNTNDLPGEADLRVNCPGGKKAIGGGHKLTRSDPQSIDFNLIASHSYPEGNPPTGWNARASARTHDRFRVTVYAVCANVAS